MGQHVSQKANDQQEVAPALKALKESSGQLPEAISMDNGYFSGNNLKTLSEENIDAYVSVGRGEKNEEPSAGSTPSRQRVKSEFEYDEKTDCFICPKGQPLALKRQDGAGRRFYQGEAKVCDTCADKARCCESKKGEARTISIDANEGLRRMMREKMRQPEAKAIYKQRKRIVEPVFGQIKNSGFRGFQLRGLGKVEGEFALVCSAHNFKKMVKAAFRGFVRPELGKWIATEA